MTVIEVRLHRLKSGKYYMAIDKLSRADASAEELDMADQIHDCIAEDVNMLLHTLEIKKGTAGLGVDGNGK